MPITFGVVGSGWRAEFFLRIAALCPQEFSVCGLVTTNKDRAAQLTQAFGVRCFATSDDLLAATKPQFLVVSVAAQAASEVALALLHKGVAVLAETPVAGSVEALLAMQARLPQGAKYQVAEQYFFQPDHAARLAVIHSGKLGDIVQARLSMTQNYHAVSLIRQYLNVGLQDARITACRMQVPGLAGFSRAGAPRQEEVVVRPQTIAVLDFGHAQGIFDFEEMQHRSWVRTQQILIKGVRGVVDNRRIRYLLDFHTPMESELIRRNLGEEENLEGAGLQGYMADGAWVYRNPFPDSRLTDDEIAIATCLQNMAAYVDGGPSIYGFVEAAQDLYLVEGIEQAARTGQPVTSTPQPWAE